MTDLEYAVTDLEYSVDAHPFETNIKTAGSICCETHKSRSVVKFDLGFESKTVVALTLSSLWNVFFCLCWNEPSLCCEPQGGTHLFVTRYMHRSLSAVLL